MGVQNLKLKMDDLQGFFFLTIFYKNLIMHFWDDISIIGSIIAFISINFSSFINHITTIVISIKIFASD